MGVPTAIGVLAVVSWRWRCFRGNGDLVLEMFLRQWCSGCGGVLAVAVFWQWRCPSGGGVQAVVVSWLRPK